VPGLYSGDANLLLFRSGGRTLASYDSRSKAIVSGPDTCWGFVGYDSYLTNFIIKDIHFSGCTVAIDIYSSNPIAVLIQNVEFHSIWRYAIWYEPAGSYYSSLSVVSSTFVKCPIAMYLANSERSPTSFVLVNNCTFSGTGLDPAQAIYAHTIAKTMSIKNCVFNSYRSTPVTITSMADVGLDNCTFSNNYNTSLRLVSIGTGVLSGCSFRNNHGINGGAIFISGTVAATLVGAVNCELANNNATNGGAVYVSGATLNVQQSTIAYNTAVVGGDFACTDKAHVYTYNCNSMHNTGQPGGCGLSAPVDDH